MAYHVMPTPHPGTVHHAATVQAPGTPWATIFISIGGLATAGAYLHLADRRLSMVVGFRWVDGSGFGDAIAMEHFYQAMLGTMITIASTCAHVARAAGVAEPSDPLAWEGWLQPENDLTVTNVVSFGGFRPEGGDDHRTGHFPAARAAGTGIEDLDDLARDWLTY